MPAKKRGKLRVRRQVKNPKAARPPWACKDVWSFKGISGKRVKLCKHQGASTCPARDARSALQSLHRGRAALGESLLAGTFVAAAPILDWEGRLCENATEIGLVRRVGVVESIHGRVCMDALGPFGDVQTV